MIKYRQIQVSDTLYLFPGYYVTVIVEPLNNRPQIAVLDALLLSACLSVTRSFFLVVSCSCPYSSPSGISGSHKIF